MSILDKAREALGIGPPTDILLVPPDKQLSIPDGAEQAIAEALAASEPLPAVDMRRGMVTYEPAPAPTEEPEPMTNTPSATAEPSAHIESLKSGIDVLRATEADLIEDIKAQMQRLANTQHAIRAYQSTIRELEQAVAEPLLDPVSTVPAMSLAPTPAT